MSGFPILDLVIGMIFIYFLLSIITSSAVEVVLTIFKARARILQQWLTEIFNLESLHPNGAPNTDIKLSQAIMDHCMLTALTKTGKSTTYMKAEDFVTALLDQISLTQQTEENAPTQLPPSDLKAYITAITSTSVISGGLKRTFIAFANQAELAAAIPGTGKSSMDLFCEKLEKWFDSNADRLTGRLKRSWAFPSTCIIASIVTVGINADSVQISKYLYDHKEVSSNLADKAMSSYGDYKERIDILSNQPKDNTVSAVDIKHINEVTQQLKKDIDSLHAALPPDFPIGPDYEFTDIKNSQIVDVIKKHIVGWFATFFAILLGAPFWFDMLNKIGNLRGTGPKPATSEESNTTIKKT